MEKQDNDHVQHSSNANQCETKNKVNIVVLEHFKKGSIRLPYAFNQMHKDNICSCVTLKVEGDVEFRAKYDKESGRLHELDNFISKLNIEWFNPVILTHFGGSHFFLKVFMISGIGISLSSKCGDFLYDMNRLSLSKIRNVIEGSLTWEEKLRFDHMTLAISRFNLYSYSVKPIIITIEESHVCSESISMVGNEGFNNMIKHSTNENLFGVMLGQIEFCCKITYNDGHIVFGRGWKNFVEGSGIEIGDVLFLQPDMEIFKIRACLVSYLETNQIRSVKEDLPEFSFLSIANMHSVEKGIIGVPGFLNFFVGHLINEENRCILPDGVTVEMTYVRDENCFHGFKGYFQQSAIEEEDFFVLYYRGKAEWFLELIRSNGIGILNSQNTLSEMEFGMTRKTYELRSMYRTILNTDSHALHGTEDNKECFVGSKFSSCQAMFEDMRSNAETSTKKQVNIPLDVAEFYLHDAFICIKAGGNNASPNSVEENIEEDADYFEFRETLTSTHVDRNSHGVRKMQELLLDS
ncbi:hypothetical protein POM88_001922 [Heracleum sosnowskyi]|uniref:TF-B3 domain-containing protein n=1 Tax=Heracleum sosnowskyi TaxID=360622 RepID=A0AAD8NAT8_9APIA|nr:hypothetical protein POM88_001922 [Heracleum sosnowskyi]